MAIIDIKDVTKSYQLENDRELIAVDRARLTIDEGEFVSIIGPSGCGKSTLLHMIGGFEQPSAGSLLLHGRPIAGPGPDRGIVFQDFVLFPWRTVLGNIAFGLQLQRRDRWGSWGWNQDFYFGMSPHGKGNPLNSPGSDPKYFKTNIQNTAWSKVG